jgi:hypothetical protein
MSKPSEESTMIRRKYRRVIASAIEAIIVAAVILAAMEIPGILCALCGVG